MNHADLITNLRFLGGRLESAMQSPGLSRADIASLRSEIRVLKSRFSSSPHVDAAVRSHVASLDLFIPEAHIEGTLANFRATWWTRLPLIRNFVHLDRIEADRTQIRDSISRLLALLRELHRLAEIIDQNEKGNAPSSNNLL